MAFSVKYKILFKVNVLHHFFLNKGLTDFSTMSDSDKEKQLDVYDCNDVFFIAPTRLTQQKLNGHNLVFKNSTNGISVWSKVSGDDNQVPFIDLDPDLNFTFLIQLKDPVFYNYTNLKLENAGKIYYFSNRKLSTEPILFPVINLDGNNVATDEKFILSAETQKAELAQLAAEEKDNLFGIIRISIKGETNLLNITDNLDKIQNPFKTFEILFNNRKTTWRYFFAQEQKVKNKDDVKEEDGDKKRLITKAEQPLTQRGFVSIELDGKELPNPNVQLIKSDTSNKYYSEIYM